MDATGSPGQARRGRTRVRAGQPAVAELSQKRLGNLSRHIPLPLISSSSAVTFWGQADDHTWLSTFPITRLEAPLPFSDRLQAKYAYWGIVDPQQLNISISGKVFTSTGQSLKNASVSLVDGGGARRTALTNAFGVYSFTDVAAFQNYTIVVTSKKFRFSPAAVTPSGSMVNVDFTGQE